MNDEGTRFIRGVLYALPLALAMWAAVAAAIAAVTR